MQYTMMTRPTPRFARTRISLLWVIVLLLASLMFQACSYGSRMLRTTPFTGEELPDADRVNLWPLLYESGDALSIMWPFFDMDEDGFALRPIVTKDGTEWTVAWPLAGWDTESGDWWLLPAYSFEENQGIFPLFNTGDWTHIGPIYWTRTEGDDEEAGDISSWGVFPLFGKGQTFTHIGLLYWNRAEDEESADVSNWGVFPIAHLGEHKGHVLPAWWSKDEDGDFKNLGVLPLFYYHNNKDEDYKSFITPLGGRGWSADDSHKFVNVLGPVFHYSSDGNKTFAAFAWPFFTMTKTPDSTQLAAWPLLDYDADPEEKSLSLLAGIYKHRSEDEGFGVRVAPLFSYGKWADSYYRSHRDLLDYLSVLGYYEDDRGTSMYIGTPLLFNWSSFERGTNWNCLLNVLDYESSGDESEFSFLYYLYRQKRKGDQVRRDFFPFFTWDSGPEQSGVSFFWRLFRYETVGDRTRGYVLGIPWGDHAEPETTRDEQPRLKPERSKI